MSTTQKTDTEVIPQDIIMIVDESGSMESMGNEPKQAVNAFIADQKKIGDGASFTLWKFNSKPTKVLDDVPMKDVPEFKDYEPDMMTALYDAIYEAIQTKLAHKKNKNVICVILTDGIENASKKHKSSDTNEIIATAKKEYNWTFIYLGANQDSFAVGGSMGVYRDNCANFDSALPGNLYELTRQTSFAVSAHRLASNLSQTEGTPTPVMNLRSVSCPPGTTDEVVPTILDEAGLPAMNPSFASTRRGTPLMSNLVRSHAISGLNEELRNL